MIFKLQVQSNIHLNVSQPAAGICPYATYSYLLGDARRAEVLSIL